MYNHVSNLPALANNSSAEVFKPQLAKLACSVSGLSGKGGVRSAECGVWKMRSVENVECGKCRVWKTPSVEDAECGKCGVWKTRSVKNKSLQNGKLNNDISPLFFDISSLIRHIH